MHGFHLYQMLLPPHAHHVAPYYLASRPASVQANPIILMLSIFGLLGGSVLCGEIVWRHWTAQSQVRRSKRHPVYAYNALVICTFTALLCYIGPDAVVFMAWPDVSPETRYVFGIANRFCDFGAFWFLAKAWYWSVSAREAIVYQLLREPLPLDKFPRIRDLWAELPQLVPYRDGWRLRMPPTPPTWARIGRPLFVMTLLMLASAALSVGR
jgi:hypothetical protein